LTEHVRTARPSTITERASRRSETVRPETFLRPGRHTGLIRPIPRAGSVSGLGHWAQQLAVLFKARVVGLLLMAAAGGAFLAAQGHPSWTDLLVLAISGFSAAAGASAINQVLERDIDGRMKRTVRRPMVTGTIRNPTAVLAIASAMVLVPPLALVSVNPALAFFLLLGAAIYVGVYTVWLKPRTILNIVLGGAAGSAAVLAGGASVGDWQSPAVLILSLLLFAWTPSHFWSLSLLYRKDYQRSGFPMLGASGSPRAVGAWILLHTIVTGLAGLSLALTPALGWGYALVSAAAFGWWLRTGLALLKAPSAAEIRRAFMASNIYLLVILLAATVASLV
jgi:protoheme IX farnesyltransferase